ncbi:hypothetical protein PTKIN_Ptkin17bG0042200 [Pterospermum kingtungense]
MANPDEVRITMPEMKTWMKSDQRNPEETRISLSEIEQSGLTKEEEKKPKLPSLDEAKDLSRVSSRTTKPLIQRVSPVLSGLKVDFHNFSEPRVVALGPLHHGNPKFEWAEQTKLRLAALFVGENETSEEALLLKIKAEIKELRKCYIEEDIKEYNDDKLAWMFFLDGCAVLYTTHYFVQGDLEKLNVKADLLVLAQLDLFLLENQLPYRVLEILIDSTKDAHQWQESITKLIGDNISTIEGSKQNEVEESTHKPYAHLLERFRSKLLKGKVESSSSTIIGRMIMRMGHSQKYGNTFRRIKDLKLSGIHVSPCKTTNLKDISFHCNILGCLKMPRLLVDDSTASKFLNLVALEMCPDFWDGYEVTNYLCFLGSLIQTAEDVKELRVAGMLHNYFGNDEELADLFRRMTKNLVPDMEHMYSSVTENIHKYCNSWDLFSLFFRLVSPFIDLRAILFGPEIIHQEVLIV